VDLAHEPATDWARYRGIRSGLNSFADVDGCFSPDGRYVVTVKCRVWEPMSRCYEAIAAVLDTQTGVLTDFPDARTLGSAAKQTLYSGLAFSRDGSHLYASQWFHFRSAGRWKGQDRERDSGLQLRAGKITPERLIHLALQQFGARTQRQAFLAMSRATRVVPFSGRRCGCGRGWSGKTAGRRQISPTMCCCWTRLAVRSRDASTYRKQNAVPGTYPEALAVSKDGRAVCWRCGCFGDCGT